jgi:ribosomal protein S18 acetylase RimI-like enzyme
MRADLRPKVTIRPARPADTPLAVSLLRLSMDEPTRHIFEDQRRPLDGLLAALFVRPSGRFSYRFASLAELDRQPVGLLLSYPGKLISKLELNTGLHLLLLLGPLGLARLAWRSRKMMRVREAEADEYYISNLAVLPPFQRQRVGTRLLHYATKATRAVGLSKCSLLVSMDNQVACRFYEGKGYRTVRVRPLSNASHFGGRHGYYRMVKSLE